MALGSALADLFTGHLAICIAALLAVPFISTWLLCRFADRRGKPPLAPHFIPFVGYAWDIAFKPSECIAKLRKRYPNSDAVSISVFGNEFHIVFDAKLCASVFRQGKILSFDRVTLMISTAFGTPKHDIDVLHFHVPESLHSRSVKDDGRRVVSEIRKGMNGDLNGDNLAEMMMVFTKTLERNLDRDFPLASTIIPSPASDEWVTLDFCEFAKRHLTLAAIPSMFGTNLLKIWPQAYEDVWSIDDGLRVLMKNVPRFFCPGIYKKRDRMLRAFVQWEKDAMEKKNIQKLTEESPAWDEHWGTRIVRHRHNTLMKNEISETGRAAQYLSLVWGQNVNAIPVAMWLLIHCFLDPDLGQRVRNVIASYRNQDGTHDVASIMADCFLKSFFLETLRFDVSTPTTRLARAATTVGPYKIDAGDVIIIPGRQLQMDQAVWAPDEKTACPSVFQAERFLDPEMRRDMDDDDKPNNRLEGEGLHSDKPVSETKIKQVTDPMALPASTASAEIRDRIQFMRPFGGGNHYCPGRYFAVQEAVVAMIAMLVSFEIEVDEQALKRIGEPQPKLANTGGMLPDRKFMVKIRRRQEEARGN